MSNDKKIEGGDEVVSIVRKAVEGVVVDAVKTEIRKSIPESRDSYLKTLAKQVLGPITIGSAIAAVVTYFASQFLGSYQAEQQRAKLDYAEKTGIYQKYKEAHRERWLYGGMVQSALAWGFSSELTLARKISYDKAFVETGRLYSFAKDYLDRVIVPVGVERNEVLDSTLEKLRTVTTRYDMCITGGFGVRNAWDVSRWSDKIKENPQRSLDELKSERDCAVYNAMSRCKGVKMNGYRIETLQAVYDNCSDVLFEQLDAAIARNTSRSLSAFNDWKSTAYPAIEDACSLEREKLVEKSALPDCSPRVSSPGLSGHEATRH